MNAAPKDPLSQVLAAVLDAQAVARLQALDPRGENRLLERVLDAFFDSLAKHVGELRDARHAADLTALRAVAHTLKSSSASIGAMQLSQRCAEVEALAREGNTAALGAPLEALQAELLRVQDALVVDRAARSE
jgi:HPt (histidine-containing phosphotransfer) domain-containing protein